MSTPTDRNDGTSGVGARLRQLREKRLLSQRDLATLAGVSQTTIVNIEGGRTRPHPSTLRRLAVALGVGPEALVG